MQVPRAFLMHEHISSIVSLQLVEVNSLILCIVSLLYTLGVKRVIFSGV